jgi:hypothetical protein
MFKISAQCLWYIGTIDNEKDQPVPQGLSMMIRQVPLDCCRRTSVALPLRVTAFPSGPIPLNDHSDIIRAISPDLIM